MPTGGTFHGWNGKRKLWESVLGFSRETELTGSVAMEGDFF